MKFTREELRSLEILDGLSDDELDWFCVNGHIEVQSRPGETVMSVRLLVNPEQVEKVQ